MFFPHLAYFSRFFPSFFPPLPSSLTFSKRGTRESRFASFYAHREPTFDLVLEDRLPSRVSHTLALQCNSVADGRGMGGAKERDIEGAGATWESGYESTAVAGRRVGGWYRNVVLWRRAWRVARQATLSACSYMCASGTEFLKLILLNVYFCLFLGSVKIVLEIIKHWTNNTGIKLQQNRQEYVDKKKYI